MSRGAYKAFLSYSRAADGKLAPALQSSLHRFAKPWYRLRAIQVYQDQTSLAVNPALWPAIQAALVESEFFLLLASPEAARSLWVQREIEYWLGQRSVERLLIVVTDGDMLWDSSSNDFDWATTDAVPELLSGAFEHEPLYVDMRWARSAEDLSLANPRFRDAVAELAAALRDRPKDELIGEDVRQQKLAA